MSSDVIGRRIVVGVDGSISSRHAALWAAAEAARRREPLRLVHATDSDAAVSSAWLAPPQSYFDALVSEGRKILADVEAEVRLAHPDLAVETTLHTTAGPAPSLIDESRGALLVVLGSRGLRGLRSVLVGSTAVGVSARAHCPVVVVRGRTTTSEPPSTGPVVVGVDGSPTSEAAVALAFQEASWRRSDLVAVHSWADKGSAGSFPSEHAAVGSGESELLAQRLAGWQETYPDVTVWRIVSSDTPADCLLKHSTDAQLLVVGSRGHGQVGGALLGSTSQALIRHAVCPILVVRPDDQD